jgi:hypothetical protein
MINDKKPAVFRLAAAGTAALNISLDPKLQFRNQARAVPKLEFGNQVKR